MFDDCLNPILLMRVSSLYVLSQLSHLARINLVPRHSPEGLRLGTKHSVIGTSVNVPPYVRYLVEELSSRIKPMNIQ